MKVRSILFVALAVTVLAGSMSGQGKKGKPPGKIDAYSMSVTALKGQSATDLCVTVQTNNAVNYPIPDVLKKLQVKVLNEDGDVMYIKNMFDVPLTNGKACVSVTDLHPLMPVEVQVHIKTAQTVDEEVLKAKTRILLRPDLIVKEVHAPAQVGPNVPFNIDAVIQEKNLHTGATANVGLWEGETVLATATGVVVAAGGQVSVLFQAVSFADAGTHNLTIKISGAVPDEYDTGNNEYPFSIAITSPVQPISYYLEYYSVKNMSQTYNYYYCGWGFDFTQSGNNGQWIYSATIPFATAGPIDSLKFESLSAGGTLSKFGWYGLIPSQSDANYEYYELNVTEADGSYHSGNLYVDKTSSLGHLYLYKFAGDYVYVYNYTDGSTYSYEIHSQQMNLEEFLEVRFLFADDGLQAGGGARVDVIAYQTISDSYGYDDGACYRYSSVYSYDYSYNYSYGMTDPTLLPSGSVQNKLPVMAADVLPLNTDLVQNYPNPFNPSTNVQFTIEHSGPAVLKVYDMLGKEVAELFRGEATEGRTYQFTFQAANFSSGMYYAKLDAGGKQYVKKMLLMK